jgi:hypothetical protein
MLEYMFYFYAPLPKGYFNMTPTPNAVSPAKKPASRKRGGELSGIRSHQGSAAHIGVQPGRATF